MKAIKITDERMAEVLPSEIKNTDVLSNNAKKVLASIMNYYLVLDKVKEQKYVYLSNQLLRQSAQIKQNYLMTAIQELVEHNLIQREVGRVWTEGQQHIASKYTVLFNNLQKPLEKKSFENLFSQFLKPSETPMGTIVLDKVLVLDKETDLDTVEDKDKDKVQVADADEVKEERMTVIQNFETVRDEIFKYMEDKTQKKNYVETLHLKPQIQMELTKYQKNLQFDEFKRLEKVVNLKFDKLSRLALATQTV